MTHRSNQRKTNGHAGPHGRANGHAPASTERGGVPVQRGQAASDDARGTSAAGAAHSASAPGTDRDACAEVAPPRPGKKNGKMKKKGKNGRNGRNEQGDSLKEFLLGGPTDFAAMQDGAAYVNSVAARVDLVGASVRLVGSKDEKIAKAELDRLREMKFGKVSAGTNVPETPTVVWDVPGISSQRNER